MRDGNTYGYDTNGNNLSKSTAGGDWTHGWDYENRLIQASSSAGIVVTYDYDALGLRVQRIARHLFPKRISMLLGYAVSHGAAIFGDSR